MPRTEQPLHRLAPRLRGFLGSSLILILAVGCRSATTLPNLPRPVDPVSDEWEEEDGIERKTWIDELHGSAPGVDWRAIERANDEDERKRRQARRAARLADDAVAETLGDWTEIGSRNQSGQTRCAALAPDGSLLIGSANGGLWRGTLEGTDWRPLSDDLGGGIDEVLAFNYQGSEAIVVRRGCDVFRSTDGGQSWARAGGLSSLLRARRWVQRGTEILLLGTLDNGQNGHANLVTALLVSQDAGATFSIRWSADAVWNGDLALEGDTPALVLLHDSALLRSTNGGQSFEHLANLGLAADSGRIAIGGAPVTAVYALLETGDEHRLLHLDTDGQVLDRGLLSDSFGTLASLPTNGRTVFVGGMELWRSTAAGAELEPINSWTDYYADPQGALHADIRGFDVLSAPGGGALALAHTDGGTYLSTDGGETWTNLCLTGLGVGQVYDTLSDSAAPGRLALGTQDQGFQVGLVEASDARGISGNAGPQTDTRQLLSGDYGYLVSGAQDHERIFASYPDFLLIASDLGSARPELDRSPWPRNASHAWMPALVADPSDSQACFLLAERLYRFAPSRTGRYRGQPYGVGRFDLDGARYLVAMAFSPLEPSRVVAADDAGGRHFSFDGGMTWSRATTDNARKEGFRPTTLVAHPQVATTFAVGGSGYGGPAVRLSEDGGQTWSPLATGLPSTLVLELAWWDANTLYAATEAGPFRWTRDSARWEPIAGDLAPATTYWSVETLPEANLVRFGTYGRGVWDFRPAAE